MTGTLRTFLALGVALSHVPGLGMKFQLGVIAVMLFYFLSGNVMYRAYQGFRAKAAQPVLRFFIDRFLRIVPAFAVAILAMVALVRSFKTHIVTFPRPDVGTQAILSNFNLLCMNDNGICKVPRIIHSSWSLGSEIHFYLLLPLLIAMPFFAFAACVAASLGWHLYALLTMEPHAAHYWAYGTSYGTLFVFCMGICYARRDDVRYRTLLACIVAFELACVVIFFPLLRPYGNFYIQEMWLGVVIAAPLVFAAEKAKGVIPAAWDRRIGALSYPIFLTHVLSMGIADVVVGMQYPSRRWMVCFLGALFVISAGMAYFVERPISALRHKLFNRLSGREAAMTEAALAEGAAVPQAAK